MNTTIFVTLTIMLTGNIINPSPAPLRYPSKSCESMAVRVVEALKNKSTEQFIALFPPKDEFIQVMERNADIYGESLALAEEEFSKNYEEKIVPQIKEEFQRLLVDGGEKGLDWTHVKLAEVELTEVSSQSFGEAEVHIFLVADGKVHRLDLTRALIIDGSWYVSTRLSLN